MNRRRTGLTARPGRTEVAALALVLAITGLAAGRRLGTPSAEFDEGVYLASADALHRGAALGTDVFASQPPLFFAGLHGAAAMTGGDPAWMRAGVLLLALAGVLAAAAVVRPVSGPAGACLAALLVGLSPAVVDRAAVVSADVPSLALGLMALAAAGAAARRPAWALAAGGLAVAAILMKLLAVPFALAVLVSAWHRRASRREWLLGLGGGAAVLVVVLVPFLGRWGALWHGAVGIRGAARGVALGGSALDGAFVAGFAGLALALVAGLAASARGRRRAWLEERAALIGLLAASAALLAVQRPLFLHHWALLSVPMAVLAASAVPPRVRRPQVVAMGVAILLLAPGAVRGRVVLAPEGRDRLDRVASVVAASTKPGAVIVSDLPLVPLAAGRAAVPGTIDASLVRVGSGALGREAVLRASSAAQAVVVGRAFTTIPGLEADLADRFPRSAFAGGVRVMLRGSPEGSMR